MAIDLKELLKTAMSLKRVAMRSRFRVNMPKLTKPNVPCVVFGNGPSLDGDIRDKLDVIQKLDTFCVGRFPESDLYRIVRPKYYVIADPMWWSSAAPDKTILIRKRLFDRMISDTSWPLLVCVPFEAKEFLNEIFSNSQNISLLFYNNVPLWGRESVLNMLFDRNLGMPPAHTVLVTALFLALRIGYKKIFLLGADHSWHETLALDDENRVCIKDVHFYDKNVGLQPFSMDGSDERIFTMDTLFQVLGKMFEGHRRVADYAKNLKVEIINASSVTYIDAYRRKNISAILTDLSKSLLSGC
ncbi:MAG: hypothetical protein Q8K18_09860 [Burkholderiales bacterium]|nr:hypothetical protein [Burkholderiales bacterium]